MQFFVKKYGLEVGQFESDFMRLAKKTDDGEVAVELHMKKVNFLVFPRSKFERSEPWSLYIPPSDTVKDLEEKIRRLMRLHVDDSIVSLSHEGADSTMFRRVTLGKNFRIWKSNIEDLDKINTWD